MIQKKKEAGSVTSLCRSELEESADTLMWSDSDQH